RNSQVHGEVTRPTHAVVKKWIKENFGMWIEVAAYYNPHKVDKLYYEYGISHKNNSWEGLMNNAVKRIGVNWIEEPQEYNLFSSPEEATDVALKYTLENLIK